MFVSYFLLYPNISFFVVFTLTFVTPFPPNPTFAFVVSTLAYVSVHSAHFKPIYKAMRAMLGIPWGLWHGIWVGLKVAGVPICKNE